MKKHFKFYLVVLLALIIALFSTCDDGGSSSSDNTSSSDSRYLGTWETEWEYSIIRSSSFGSGNYEKEGSWLVLSVETSGGELSYSLNVVRMLTLYSDPEGSENLTTDDAINYMNGWSAANSYWLESGSFTASGDTITTLPTGGESTTYTVEYSNDGGGKRMVLTSDLEVYEFFLM